MIHRARGDSNQKDSKGSRDFDWSFFHISSQKKKSMAKIVRELFGKTM